MNYFNYFSEIEELFIRRRGRNLLLSPLDWALIESWQEREVPLQAFPDGPVGVENVGGRDAGTAWVWSFALLPGQEHATIEALLGCMEEGDEVAFPDPAAGECWRELRRTPTGWQRKRGCHGAHGTWRSCDAAEALDWLLAVSSFGHAARPGAAPATLTRPRVLPGRSLRPGAGANPAAKAR